MSEIKCCICGDAIDHENGAASLMMAFCYNHSTTLTNVSYCGECFERLVKGPLGRLNIVANLQIPDMDAKEEAEHDER